MFASEAQASRTCACRAVGSSIAVVILIAQRKEQQAAPSEKQHDCAMPVSINISHGLIEQLQEESGLAAVKKDHHDRVGPAAPVFTPGIQSLDGQSRAEVRSDKQLAAALHSSRTLGGLLLKHEEEELAKVNAHTQSILWADRMVQQRQACCAAERDACLQCYEQHTGDELQCASAVQAYDECARQCLLKRYAGS